MDVVKRLLGLTNCHGEKRMNDGQEPCLTGYNVYYFGYVFAKQPDSIELQQAIAHLIGKQRTPFVFTFDEDSMIGLAEDNTADVVKLEMHRVVLSCVDARNQKVVAIFYHNPDNPKRDLTLLCALECHVLMCKTREQAKKFAERMSDELIYTYRKRRRMNMVSEERPETRAFAKYVSYENLKAGQGYSESSQSTGGLFTGGSTSTCYKDSSTTVASCDTEYRRNSSSGIWESFQDLDLACEDANNPSTIPKSQLVECPVQVHRHLGSATRKRDIVEEEPRIDISELSSLVDMEETSL